MAPKKKESGPSVQDIEDAWKKREAEWQEEEKQLQYFVQLQQDDARHYRMRSQELAVEVESLALRSQYHVSRSTDLRIQFQKQCKALALAQEQEASAMKEQENVLAHMNEQVQNARTEVSAMVSKLETAQVEHADQVKAVTFRNSGISALRERVVKLRNQRTKLLADVKQVTQVLQDLQGDPSRRSFRRKPAHMMVVSEPCASLERCSFTLQSDYGFDVSWLRPTSVCCGAASGERANKSVDATTAASDGEGLKSVLSSFAVIAPTNELFCVPIHKAGDSPLDDPATIMMRHLHDFLYTASRGGFHDERRIVVVVGVLPVEVNGYDTVDLQGLAFRLPVDDGTAASSTLQEEQAASPLRQSNQAVICRTQDIFDVLMRRASPVSSLVTVELVSADMKHRFVLIACTEDAVSSNEVPRQRQFAPTVIYVSLDVKNDASNPQATSVVGQVLQLVLEEQKLIGKSLLSSELAHRLSMKLLVMMPHSRIISTPLWFREAARVPSSFDMDDDENDFERDDLSSLKRRMSESDNCASAAGRPLLPVCSLERPVSLRQRQLVVEWFADSSLAASEEAVAVALRQFSKGENSSARPSWCSIDSVKVGASPTKIQYRVHSQDSMVTPHMWINQVMQSVRHELRIKYGLDLDSAAYQWLCNVPIALAAECVAWRHDGFIVEFSVPAGDRLDELVDLSSVLRGEDRRRAEAGSAAHPLRTLPSIIEADVATAFPDAANLIVTRVVPASMLITLKADDVGKVITSVECWGSLSNSECDEVADSAVTASQPPPPPPSCYNSTWSALTVRLPSASFVSWGTGVCMNDSLHLRRIRNTPSAQQIIVLIVTASSSASWEEQQQEVNDAHKMLIDAGHRSGGISIGGASNGRTVLLPQDISSSIVYSFVSISDLSCTPEDRAAMMGEVESSAIDSPLSRKRAVWRNVMNILPQNVVQFAMEVTYPCLIVTSPLLSPVEYPQGIVVPRSTETRKSLKKPDCVFPSGMIARAVASFYACVLRSEVTMPFTSTTTEDISSSRMASPTALARTGERGASIKKMHSLHHHHSEGGTEITNASLQDNTNRVTDSLPQTWITV